MHRVSEVNGVVYIMFAHYGAMIAPEMLADVS